jgi:uncharacterized protein (TIGR02453 family)
MVPGREIVGTEGRDMRPEFLRFPPEMADFLVGLREHNNKEWFHAHSADYEKFCFEPARRFVEAVGSELREFIPDIRAEPKILGSIFRITHDTRYGRSERPYKDYLDFYFWEGERKRAVSGLFVRISPDFIGIGAGCHGFDAAELELFRQTLATPRYALALAKVVNDLETNGYRISGEHYKRTPKGASTVEQALRFLRFNALFVHVDEPVELAISEGRLMAACIRHWRRLAPLHRWLTGHVQNGVAA